MLMRLFFANTDLPLLGISDSPYRFLQRVSIRLREVCIILNLVSAFLTSWKPVN